MKKTDFERAVRAEARTYDGSKDGVEAGLLFWMRLSQEHPDLTCNCRTCTRNDPWQHVKVVLRGCGFGESATS